MCVWWGRGEGRRDKGSKCSLVIRFLIITIKYLALPSQPKKKKIPSGLWQFQAQTSGPGSQQRTFLPLGPCTLGLPHSSLKVWAQLYRHFSPVTSLPAPWICHVGSPRDAALFRVPPSPLGCSPWSRRQSLAGDFSSFASSVEGQGVRMPNWLRARNFHLATRAQSLPSVLSLLWRSLFLLTQ